MGLGNLGRSVLALPSSGNQTSSLASRYLNYKAVPTTVNLRETTRDIISQVERQTGFPVQVIDGPDLEPRRTLLKSSRLLYTGNH